MKVTGLISIKYLKCIVIYMINIVMGFFSMRYVMNGIGVAINIKQGSGYYNPEGESIKFIGYIMLLYWIVIVESINIGLIKMFMGNVKEKLCLFYQQKFQWKNVLFYYIFIPISLLLGGIIRFAFLYYSYDVR